MVNKLLNQDDGLKPNLQNAPQGEFVLFQSGDGQTKVECRFEADTLWLTQKMLADLYQKKINTINEHLTAIYQDGELDQNSTIRKFRIVQQEGKRQVTRDIEHYILCRFCFVTNVNLLNAVR